MALLDAIRNGTVGRVLIWSIDRIGKSLVDLVAFMETCRTAGAALWIEEQGIDTETSNGMSMLDFAAMMALHLRQSRRDRILRGQAAARSLSIRFGRPPIPTAKIEKAKQFLAMGKGVREVARLAGGISPSSVSRIAASLRSTASSLTVHRYCMKASGQAGEIGVQRHGRCGGLAGQVWKSDR